MQINNKNSRNNNNNNNSNINIIISALPEKNVRMIKGKSYSVSVAVSFASA